MRKTLLFLLLLVIAFGANAQDKTILLTETGLPYTNIAWFYSGSGNGLQQDELGKNWDVGRRIISSAYTRNGWLVVMAEGSGIGMQTYSYTDEWPSDWVQENWGKGYQITSISKGNGKWLVVMSQGVSYNSQTYWCTDWATLEKWYHEQRKEGRFITSMAYDGKNWMLVLSKGSPFSTQGYLFANSYDKLVSDAHKEIWGKNYRIHLLEYGGGSYFVVYGNYSQNNARGQYFHVDPSNASEYINKSWNDSYYVAYVGGGYASQSETISANNNTGKYGQRTGEMWYTNEGGQQIYFNFCFNEGEYLVNSSDQGMGYDWWPRYVMRDETADSYIFYEAMYYYGRTTQKLVLRGSTPKMIVAKNWSKITIKNTMVGDIVLTKEISKAEYDKMMQDKKVILNAFENEYNRTHPQNNNHNDHNDNDSHNSKNSTVTGVCPDCNGKGYRPQAYDYAAGSSFSPYHNHSGNQCYICGSYTDHYHYRCTTCKKW